MTVNEKIKYLSEAPDLDIWKKQMEDKTISQLMAKYKQLLKELDEYEEKELRSANYFILIDKIEYIEHRLRY